MGLECEILGPLRLRFDGREVRLPGGRQRTLLALLACNPNVTIPAERLIDALWGSALPANPTNPLQQAVFQFRRTLDGCGAVDVLVTTDGGYRFAVDAEHIDATRFESAVRTGEHALRAGDLDTAGAALSRGLALWRGDALQDVTADWAVAEAERLNELRLSATASLVDARLALGHHAECVGELTTLVAAHPLREQFRAQLMRALAGAGRQADALTVYAQGCDLLAEELGLDPSAVLRRAHEDVLHQRTDAVQGPPATESRGQQPAAYAAEPGGSVGALDRPPAAGAGSLPRPRTSFVGREEELGRLEQLLGTERILTVTGPGGAGKSRLALELGLRVAGADARRSVHLAELAPLAKPALLVRTVAAALRVHLDPDDEVVPSLLAGIAPEPRILLLDNAEHLLPHVAELVDQLVSGCPQVTVLVTSREPLGLTGEVVWPVPTLPVPPEGTTDLATARSAPAVQLFEARARAVTPGFELVAEEVETVVALVRALDGLPLAIELAAARTRILSLSDLAAQLHDRFRLLRDQRRGRAPRHRALEDTVEWSWDLLTEDERRAWMAAAVPRRPFCLDLLGPLLAATGADLDPLDAVEALCDRSLLTVQQREGTTSYRMLETLREFGAQQLADSGVEPAVRAAHAAAISERIAATDRNDPVTWSVDVAAQLSDELDARAALRWWASQEDRTSLQQLAGRLGWLWYATGRTHEGITWLDRALGPVDALDPAAADPKAITWAAMLRIKSATAASEGLRWARHAVAAADDPILRELARIAEVAHLWFAGDREGARIAAERGVGGQDGWLEGTWQLLCGQILAAEGQLAEAEAALERAGTHLEAHGAGWWSVVAAETLLPLQQLRGDADNVRRAGAHSLAVCQELAIPNPVVEVELRSCLAMVAATVGDDATADTHRVAATALVQRSGAGLAHAVHAAAEAYIRVRRSELAEARSALATAGRWHDRAGRFFGRPFVLWLSGHVALCDGDMAGARTSLRDAYELALRQGVGDERACALEGLAALCAAREETDRAALLLGAADALREQLGAPRPVLTLRDLEPQGHLLARVATTEGLAASRGRGAALDSPALRTLVRSL